MQLVKIIFTVAAIALYIALGHFALTEPDPHSPWRQLAVLLVILPIIGISGWGLAAALEKSGLAPWPRRLLTAVPLLGMGGASLAWWPRLLERIDWLYLAQHSASNLLLCYFFARTLFGARVPVVTTLAQTIHGNLPVEIQRYTRKVTIAWSVFFAAQVAVSLLIYVFLPIEAWSWFANVLNWPLVGLMFVTEYLCRKVFNPHFEHASLRQSIAAYRNQRNQA